ncbi:DUF4198 domain-containing protein [Caenimonas sedimenti]|uniref:DUF4198 domain-containing protein n=1 Tax=Caenimonas sedimenti TaxID=2596921 RepID=UPI0016473A7C|nr:DUF4198 domain-containing protein [Caenimonas sedimenti]
MHAHEFWLEAAGSGKGQVALRLYVGEALVGERVAWTRAHAESFRVHTAAGVQDLTAEVPAEGLQPEFLWSPGKAGTHLLAYESLPSFVTLEAGQFNAYLREEGLTGALEQRASSGQSAQPGRERFRRSAKLLLGGGAADTVHAMTTGQRIEIVPLDDPLRHPPARPLRFEVRFGGQRLPGVLVKAWHRRNTQTVLVRAITDDAGRVVLELPHAGEWLLNAVHMVPAADAAIADWDSYWASLSFRTPVRRPARSR